MGRGIPSDIHRVALDTNVLLDLVLDRGAGPQGRSQTVAALLRELVLRGVVMTCASLSLKDVFYLSSMALRRSLQPSDSELERLTVRLAVSQAAWGGVERIMDCCEVIAVDEKICAEAARLRSRHDDFEDDLIVAAARAARCDVLVTSDGELAKHFPDLCASPRDLLDDLATVS